MIKEIYIVSKNKNGLWYAYHKDYPYMDIIGSYSENRSDAMEYAKNKNKELEIDRKSNSVTVVGLDKGTGYIKASTSCDKADGKKYAKYYRSIGYNSSILNGEELEIMLEKERRERKGLAI